MLLTMFAGLLLAQSSPLAEEVACITARVPVPNAAALVAEANAGGRDAPIRTTIDRATAECAGERHWSDDRSTSIGRLASAALLARASRTILSDNGIDPGLIDRWFAERPTLRYGNRDQHIEAATEVVSAVARSGIDSDRLDAQIGTIVQYSMTLLLLRDHGL